MKEKKSVPKFLKIILIVLLVILAAVIAIVIFAPDPEDTEPTTTAATETIPPRSDAVGKSDGDASELLDGSKPHAMLNDVTGKWKLTTFAASDGDIERYALGYYRDYFESDDEIHWLVNFTNKTTTCIKYSSGLLFVDTFEYVDKEEHDAKAIGGGLPLSSFIVYPDNGDIEKVS